MKKILFLTILNLCYFAYASESSVEIKHEGKNPVVGETFNVSFIVSTDRSESPSISFRPVGLEVLSRKNAGRSTSTTYINGQLTVKKSVQIDYQLVANKTGPAYIRDILIQIGSEKIQKKDIRFVTLSEKRKGARYFILPIASDERPFVGESVIVRYYLYSKTEVHKYDIKQYPDFKKVIKRYHQERDSLETISYNGEMYYRRLVYTAQIFPLEEGKFSLPKASFNIVYSDNRSRSSFPFGISMGALKTKTLNSKTVKIDVRSIPTKGLPPDFTGLVGKHDVNFSISKTKFLVNEPIEIKVVISGNGALERLSPPSLINDQRVEEFDVNSDLRVDSNFSGQQTFLYSYLGRERFSSEEKEINLSFFDPEKEAFYSKSFQFPAIDIKGGASATPGSKNDLESASSKEAKQQASIESVKLGIVGPEERVLSIGWLRIIQIAFVILIAILSLLIVLRYAKELRYDLNEEIEIALRKLQQGSFSYTDLFLVVSHLSKKRDSSIYKMIENLELKPLLKEKLKKLADFEGERFKKGAKSTKKVYLSRRDKRVIIGELKKYDTNKNSKRNQRLRWQQL